MKICVHFPVYKRPKITDLACDSLDRVLSAFREQGIDSVVYMIGDEPSHRRRAKRRGYEWVEQPNDPVGTKFNRGVREMLKDDSWTHMMEFCSDNILEEKYPEIIGDLMRKGLENITLSNFYIMDWRTKEIRIFSKKAWSNVGRITSRAIIEKLRGRFGYWYEPRIQTKLDLSFHRMIQKIGRSLPFLLHLETPLIIDIKDGNSMHGYQSFAALPEIYPVVDLEGNFPEIKTHTNGQDQKQ